MWKRALIAVTSILALSLTGCSSSVGIKNISDNVLDINKVEIESAVIGIITSGEVSENNEMFASDFSFTPVDSEIMEYDGDYKMYFSENAVYVQVNRSMYRFQFNADRRISSYIKYSLEA